MIDIKNYLYGLLKSLKVLKDIGIYHRDIKPGNFLYNPSTRKGVIVDFGLSEIVLIIMINNNFIRLKKINFNICFLFIYLFIIFLKKFIATY